MSEVAFPQFKVAVNVFLLFFAVLFSIFSFWILGLPLLPDEMVGLKKLFPDPIWATVFIVVGLSCSSLLLGAWAVVTWWNLDEKEKKSN